MLLEIIDSSIIELELSLQIPANNVLQQIHLIATLPAGLTYAKSIGATAKKPDEMEWKKDGIIDKSFDVELEKNHLINHSQIDLILDQSISRPIVDTDLDVCLPVAVYDADLLIEIGTLEIEVKLSSDFKTYSSEFIPLQLKKPLLDLYGHSQAFFENNLPIIGQLKFCFQTLNCLAPISTDWTYQLIVHPIDEIKLNYPFTAYISKTFNSLTITTTLDYVELAYTTTIPHQNEQKGDFIFIEIPYSFNPSITTNQNSPLLLNQEAELHFYNGIEQIKDFTSTGHSQIKILETPPTYKVKFHAIIPK